MGEPPNRSFNERRRAVPRAASVYMRFLYLLLIAVVIVAAAWFLVVHSIARDRMGMDLYQYWGVGQVVAATGGQVRNPYREQQRFNRVLAQMAERTDDLPLARVAYHRQNLELQGTPVAYWAFSIYPGNYSTTLSWHYKAQVVTFSLAVLLALVGSGGRILTAIGVLSVLILFYEPFYSEITVGNFNSFLILCMAASMVFLGRVPTNADSASAGWRWASAAMAVLGVAALVKPTVAPMFFAVVACVVARVGPRAAITYVGLASLPVLAIAAGAGSYFGTPMIWYDWFSYFGSSNVDMYNISFDLGNFSVPLFLANQWGASFGTMAAALLLVVAVSLTLTVTRHASLTVGLRASLRDPLVALAFGAVLFFAISPLAWVHYHLLLLPPALMLVSQWRVQRTEAVIALVAIYCASMTPILLLELLGVEASQARRLATYGVMFAWPLLWAATLCRAARCAREAGGEVSVAQVRHAQPLSRG
ncbi:MAG: hypothetical protein ACI8PT_001110 [Gammaproteobacteria bacterium]|jgi:hypothetical protein